MEAGYLSSVKKQFEYYKLLGEKTFAQLSDAQLFWQHNEDSNSVATLVQHLHGNMLSRWTNFLTTDGEKEWRNRDAEFENITNSREGMLAQWNAGWACLFSALDSITDADLERIIYIRNQGHTIMEAINRQLAHYPYHVGQIVFLGKMLSSNPWESLSIPRGNSQAYNHEKFSKPKHKAHFTDELLKQQMTKAEIFEQLKVVHEQLWAAAGALPEAQQGVSRNGKWSALHNVEHINKSVEPTARFFTLPREVVKEKFGLADRPSLSIGALEVQYNAALQQGVKAPAQYVPAEKIEGTLADLAAKGRQVLEALIMAADGWTEEELDRYFCPHPALGKITARELLLSTIFHCQHHTRSVELTAV